MNLHKAKDDLFNRPEVLLWFDFAKFGVSEAGEDIDVMHEIYAVLLGHYEIVDLGDS